MYASVLITLLCETSKSIVDKKFVCTKDDSKTYILPYFIDLIVFVWVCHQLDPTVFYSTLLFSIARSSVVAQCGECVMKQHLHICITHYPCIQVNNCTLCKQELYAASHNCINLPVPMLSYYRHYHYALSTFVVYELSKYFAFRYTESCCLNNQLLLSAWHHNILYILSKQNQTNMPPKPHTMQWTM